MRGINERSSTKWFESFTDLKNRYCSPHLLARGYFCLKYGDLTEEIILEYLEDYFEVKGNDNFRIEG